MPNLACLNCKNENLSIEIENDEAVCLQCQSRFPLDVIDQGDLPVLEKNVHKPTRGVDCYTDESDIVIEYHWYYYAGWKLSLLGAIIILLISITILLFATNHLILQIITVLFIGLGTFFLYDAITKLLNVTTIRINQDGLSIKHKLPVYSSVKNRIFSKDEIENIFLFKKPAGSIGNKKYTNHTIVLKSVNEGDITLISDCLDITCAQFIETTIEKNLDIRDKKYNKEYQTEDEYLENQRLKGLEFMRQSMLEIRPETENDALRGQCNNCQSPLYEKDINRSSGKAYCTSCKRVIRVNDLIFKAIKNDTLHKKQEFLPVGLKRYSQDSIETIKFRLDSPSCTSVPIMIILIVFNFTFLNTAGHNIYSFAPGIVLICITFLVFYGLFKNYFTIMYVILGHDRIDIFSNTFFFWNKIIITCSPNDVMQLYVIRKETESNDSKTVDYDLMIQKRDDSHLCLIEGVKDYRPLIYMETEIEKYYKIKDSPVKGEFNPVLSYRPKNIKETVDFLRLMKKKWDSRR